MLKDEFSENDFALRDHIGDLRMLEIAVQQRLWARKRLCQDSGHVVIRKKAPEISKGKQKGGWYNEFDFWGSANCAVCGEDLGWYCPESPNGYCEYKQEDGGYNEDRCRYCGEPEERK